MYIALLISHDGSWWRNQWKETMQISLLCWTVHQRLLQQQQLYLHERELSEWCRQECVCVCVCVCVVCVHGHAYLLFDPRNKLHFLLLAWRRGKVPVFCPSWDRAYVLHCVMAGAVASSCPTACFSFFKHKDPKYQISRGAPWILLSPPSETKSEGLFFSHPLGDARRRWSRFSGAL